MGAFFIILSILLAALAIFGIGLYLHSKRTLRIQKNYERGLKMVPLLIHLPPMSDDTEANGRDVRDVTDENISKAQILYNIIASTFQKGYKSKFYGQRHISFEIIGSKGFVHYYAAVPVAMVDVVKQAVVSAYPSARLEEVSEHNIFSPVGKISGTIGGEMVLKEHFANPIATYQELKRDAMQTLLNALSTLDKEDGAGIQIMIRPTSDAWRKKATNLAGKQRKGEDKKKGGAAAFGFAKDLVTAIAAPPEPKDKKPEDKKELSPVEQAKIEAMEGKTQFAAFEVLIRVVASSNISARAHSILKNVVASFALYDSPGKNGFKYVPAKDIESFVTAYIMRFFPQENNKNILNAVELSTIFHFPDQKNIPTSQLERQASKQVDGPRNISDRGLMLGYNLFRGAKTRINLDPEDRRRHVYAVGQTGTGKSTLLENMALQDMLNGDGFAFIDPHGDVVERLLAMVPRERTEDVIYFSPAEMEYPMGLNLFEYEDEDQKDFLIQETINMLYKLYDPNHQGIMGPRYESLFRHAALTIMADPEGGTFVDIPKLFNDNAFVQKKLKHVKDPATLDFWLREYPQSQRSNEAGEVKSWFVSKFGAFLSNTMMRNIIGQTKSSFNMREIMDNKKILLVNLSKGRTGELNSKLLGMIFVMKFQAAAMSRANIDEKDRVDFGLYVDEFQNFSTDSFATILSEARKYRLNLIVANQFTTQLTEEIRDAVFGNIGTIVSFRVGTNDAEFLAKYFAPVFDINDLQRVPNYNAVVRMLIGGVPTQSFSMASTPPLGTPNPQLLGALKQLSAAKYGRPRAQVEADIFKRLESPQPGAKPGVAGAQPGSLPLASSPYAQAPAQPKPASLLDDYLQRRQTQPVPPPVAPRRPFGRQDPATSMPPAPTGFAPSTQAPQSPSPFSPPRFAGPSAPTTGFNPANPAFTTPINQMQTPQPQTMPLAPAPTQPMVQAPAPLASQPAYDEVKISNTPTPAAPVAPVLQPAAVAPVNHVSHDLLPMQAPVAEEKSYDPLLEGSDKPAEAPRPDPNLSLGNPDAGKAVSFNVAPKPGEGTKNISSNEIEELEAAKIAQELKNSMGMPGMTNNEPTPNLEAGDTIVIDQDGNLKPRDVSVDPAA